MRRVFSWLLAIASPSKAVAGDPNMCMIANCNLYTRYKGLHYLLGDTIHVCWFHRWSVKNARAITADDRLTLSELFARELNLTPPSSHSRDSDTAARA